MSACGGSALPSTSGGVLLCNVISALRDVEVKVVDLRDGGKAHHLTIGPTGFVHETYGARPVVNDVRLLLETPGRPVYASRKS
ncbi:hypothetical protein GAS19_30010 (plasmid) [Burkholderia glumae]|nr:hypothetical protein GAS19_30010 [Burkholderia glumae]QHP94936.1 hypothetical protein EXE55_28740 [Burkholderia glumae]UVT00104.1 hypothetical protein EFP19_30595 [Burkholderia glumae]